MKIIELCDIRDIEKDLNLIVQIAETRVNIIWDIYKCKDYNDFDEKA